MPLMPGVSTMSAPKALQQNAALQAHGVGHGEDQLVAFHRGNERQRDAGVAAGRLDQHGLAGLDFPGALGLVDHADADAVFHAAARVLAFQLGDDGGLRAAVTLLRRTKGVFPISSVTSFAIFIAISQKFDLRIVNIRFDSAEASKESAKGNNNSARFEGGRQPRRGSTCMSG